MQRCSTVVLKINETEMVRDQLDEHPSAILLGYKIRGSKGHRDRGNAEREEA